MTKAVLHVVPAQHLTFHARLTDQVVAEGHPIGMQKPSNGGDLMMLLDLPFPQHRRHRHLRTRPKHSPRSRLTPRISISPQNRFVLSKLSTFLLMTSSPTFIRYAHFHTSQASERRGSDGRISITAHSLRCWPPWSVLSLHRFHENQDCTSKPRGRKTYFQIT